MNDLLLSIEEAEVLIAGKPFFENLTFHIHAGHKIALVGKNGAGKTTLMNLITGDKEIDGGKYWRLPGVHIGYMQQNITPKAGETVGDFLEQALKLYNEKHADDEMNIDESYKIDIVLSPLGLSRGNDMQTLSGGQLRRAALAFALVEEPDILLLDEPTNHLDLGIIEWLEDYLKAYKGAVLCVSHDRAFLSEISDKVFWLDRGQIKVSPEGFATFQQWSQDLLDQESRELHNREKKLEIEMRWANRGMKARRKRNVRRLNLAHDSKEELKKDKAAFRKATTKIDLPAPQPNEESQIIAEFFNVYKSFSKDKGEIDKPDIQRQIILEKFNLRLKNGNKIGILGKNGSGKSTFLKLLIGEEQADKGKIKRKKDLEFSYFEQTRAHLQGESTLQNFLCPSGSDHLMVRGKSRHVCGYLKDYLFAPDDAWRKISTLSGGQKNRLMLAKILANPNNLLILDEPTNDLDMDTLDMLESILSAYNGTLIVVSHDRDFLNKTVDMLLVFEGDGQIETVVGDYNDYLRFRRQMHKEEENNKMDGAAKPSPPIVKNEKDVKAKKPKKIPYHLKYQYEHLPSDIEKIENEIKELENTLADSTLYVKNPDMFTTATRRYGHAKAELAELEEKWLKIADEIGDYAP